MGAYGGRRPTAKMGLWWGYLPLVLVSALVVAMVYVVPSEVPDVAAGSGGSPTVKGENESASGWGDNVTACPDRQKQVEGDGYSPPCFAFAQGADNGGETTHGVTKDKITVTYRMTPDNNLLKLLASTLGTTWDEPDSLLPETAAGLVDYFNKNFQFYGRKLELKQVQGAGSFVSEFTGGGQEQASSDAIKAHDAGAFADVTGLTQPYAEALTRQKVVNIGAPYMSREWFTKERPYSWSNFPDCSVVAEVATEFGVKSVLGRPAKYADGDIAGRNREIGLVIPDNLEYQQCGDAGEKVIKDAGMKFKYRGKYVLDLTKMDPQADSLVAALRDKGVTSVACGCDPIMLSKLAQKAEEAGYFPEWLIIGVGFIDLDLVGQMVSKVAPDQWKHAFGGSPSGAQQPIKQSDGYKAYKSVHPDKEPSILADIVYYQLYQLAIGIQMAGPDLTPETFETGMFSYPVGQGPAGRWDFAPNHYTGASDARIVWWDPDQPSLFNGKPGTYRDTGERFKQGELPEGELKVFQP